MSSLFYLPSAYSTAGAKLYFYATGTSTPQNTYQDADLTTPHANPVVADSAGQFAQIFLDPSLPDYRVVKKTSADVTTDTWDDVAAGATGISALFAKKPSNTTKTSTTTLASDVDLHVALPTAGLYSFEAFLRVDLGAGTGAGGVKFFIDYTGTLTGVEAPMHGFSNITGTSAVVSYVNAYTTTLSFATVGSSQYLKWSGLVEASNAGTLAIQWAQNTSSVQPTILMAGSYIKAERVD